METVSMALNTNEMKIDDLIEKLQMFKRKYGNIEVRVQYRDSGGDYYGTDEPYAIVSTNVEKDEGDETKTEKFTVIL